MVPGIGPFAGMFFSGSATRSLGLGLSGVFQLAGLGMTFVGLRTRRRLKRETKMSFTGGATRNSAQATMAIRF